MEPPRWARPLFAVGVVYNLFGALAWFASPELHQRLFWTERTDSALARVNGDLFWSAVLLYALGYAMLAMDPRQNRAVVWMAMLGKGFVCVEWTRAWLAGDGTTLLFLGGVGDGLFALAFAIFLVKTR